MTVLIAGGVLASLSLIPPQGGKSSAVRLPAASRRRAPTAHVGGPRSEHEGRADDDDRSTVRGDDDRRHPVKTEKEPDIGPGIISPLTPINSTDLTHVPRHWLVSEHQLDSQGRDRTYLMIRPPLSTPGTLPVVVVLHGRRMNPAAIERISRLIPIVGRAVFVYPAGFGRSWNAGGCCGIAHAAGVDDVAFLETVVSKVLASQHDTSARRVYLMGFSNGGRMAYRMACLDPGAFAGVAAVEAVPVFQCHRLDPTPLVIVAQTGDPLLTVATDGHRKTMDGYLEPTVGATVDQWRSMDGCSRVTTTRAVGRVEVTRFEQCRTGGRVEYDLYPGDRHAWPEGHHRTPSAGELIWSFFDRNTLPAARSAPRATRSSAPD
jgi:polyhydroxybutyrate depolymerase